MLNKLRWKAAEVLALKALGAIESGGFDSIMKGIIYYKYALIIAPLSQKDKNVIAAAMKSVAEKHGA